MWWIEPVIKGIVWGVIAAVTSVLGGCLVWAWHEWKERREVEDDA